ncbi:protein KINESIN LIGHT CHAIN-RELATED 2-like [Prosopis cineraria]|uniref:protein KINESIN LIGHT CHAIN-RELATED 2-like n=1 Tax=Prosopis cineraria TaxID=364024 RepID=UPI00241056D3|nr:protein KINESIN LIGHT CHAIN-RELATED 2-like [Prosopis cineraria]
MPGLAMNDLNKNSASDERSGGYTTLKENFTQQASPRSPFSSSNFRSGSIDLPIDGLVDNSIEQLYRNVCDLLSSDHSPSRVSFYSYGEEARIDSELCHLVGDFADLEITKEVITESKVESDTSGSAPENDIASNGNKYVKKEDMNQSSKSTYKGKNLREKPPIDKRNEKNSGKGNPLYSLRNQRNVGLLGVKPQNGLEGLIDDPDLGPFLLKQTREMISSGENMQKALDLALRALNSFEICANGEPSLQMVMCLHVLATIYSKLGQQNEAIPILERSIDIPVLEYGQDHALAKFAGCMQLGDTYAMMGHMENSISFYTQGLKIQRQALGETDPRLGDTCRYVAEAHFHALQFEEAKYLCQNALDIHRKNRHTTSLEEALDRRLMGLICDSKGDYEVALEHYASASMIMAANGQELDAASVDCSIGDANSFSGRYDEAVLAYQKALTVFRSTKGGGHAVASVYVRLADLYHKIGKLKESKYYCENAVRIFGKTNLSPCIPSEEIASGLVEVAATYESMNDIEQAVKLLKKALKIYDKTHGQQSTSAGIEAQIGVMYYMLGNYCDSYNSFKSAIARFRASEQKESASFGIALNQMGLVCVQLYAINEAAEMFQEARSILEQEYGPYHPHTLGVCSNLAATYDAMSRVDDAIEILEYVIGLREEKYGRTSDLDDEKRRLADLLKEAGRAPITKHR